MNTILLKRLVLLILLSGCSSEIVVHTDFDKRVEIHRKTRYTWLDAKNIEARNNPLFYNELNFKRIRTAVDQQLKNKGYILVQGDPEFILHFHIILEDKTTVETDPFGYYYGNYWMRRGIDSYRYREGTLIIDVMDAANCDLIWRGWAVSILDDTQMMSEETIQAAVVKIFKSFPVAAAMEVYTP